jgi:hypothetical protein
MCVLAWSRGTCVQWCARCSPQCVTHKAASSRPAIARPYRDLCNSQYLNLLGRSRSAGQGPKLPPKLSQNFSPNCPVCVAMTARKGWGGGPPGHLPAPWRNCPKTGQNDGLSQRSRYTQTIAMDGGSPGAPTPANLRLCFGPFRAGCNSCWVRDAIGLCTQCTHLVDSDAAQSKKRAGARAGARQGLVSLHTYRLRIRSVGWIIAVRLVPRT